MRRGKYPESDSDEAVTDGNPGGHISNRGLEGNPAKTGEVFTDECPYVRNADGYATVNKFSEEMLLELAKTTDKTATVLINGEQKDVKINKIGLEETASKRFGNPDYWLKNEIASNIEKYLQKANYDKPQPIDISHNSGKTLKLKKKMLQAHKLNLQLGTKSFVITLFERKVTGELLFYYIAPK